MPAYRFVSGWRRSPHHDENDHIYVAPPRLKANLPRKVNLASPRLPAPFEPTWSQLDLGACFPPGTLVRMADGSQKKIEEVHLLDRVLTAERNIGSVVRTMVRPHNGDLVKLQIWGHNHLKMTEEHPVLTRRGYVAAGSLEAGDWVAMPRYLPESSALLHTTPHLGVPKGKVRQEYVRSYAGVAGRGGVSVLARPVPEIIHLSPGAGRIFGLFLAEGSVDPAKVIWTFGSHETETLAEELVRLLADEFGVEARLQIRRKSRGSVNVVIYGTVWANLFRSLFSTGAGRKRIHPDVACGPREFMTAILDGWLDGDGSTDGRRRGGVSVSHELAMSMFDIAQAAGRRPAVMLTRPRLSHGVKSRQPRWDVDFMMDGKGDSYRCEQDDTYVWRKVRLKERVPFDGPVFNLEVEGDNSYVAEGIGVHNCGPHSAAKDVVLSAFRQDMLSACPMPSRLFIYWCVRKLMGTINQDSGVDNRTLFKALNQFGWCDESLWPYDITRFRDTPPDVCFQQAATRRIKEYLSVPQDLDTMRARLAGGDSFVIGFTCYESMFTKEVERTGKIPLPKRGDTVAGGHDMLCTGFDDDLGVFTGPNSWGPDWGDNGYYQMPYEYATNPRRAGDFWSAVHSGLPVSPTPPPEPPPTPPPAPSGRKIMVTMTIDQNTGRVDSSAGQVQSEQAQSTAGLYMKSVFQSPRECGQHFQDTSLTPDRIALLVARGWGKAEDWGAAAGAGITVLDVIDWANRYGLGINALIGELLSLYRNGQLNLSAAVRLFQKYGPGLGSLILDVMERLGLDVQMP